MDNLELVVSFSELFRFVFYFLNKVLHYFILVLSKREAFTGRGLRKED